MHCVSEELRLKLTDRIFELTESKVRELGYELYDVEYQKGIRQLGSPPSISTVKDGNFT